jgi:sensor histidine kinase YesM
MVPYNISHIFGTSPTQKKTVSIISYYIILYYIILYYNYHVMNGFYYWSSIRFDFTILLLLLSSTTQIDLVTTLCLPDKASLRTNYTNYTNKASLAFLGFLLLLLDPARLFPFDRIELGLAQPECLGRDLDHLVGGHVADQFLDGHFSGRG